MRKVQEIREAILQRDFRAISVFRLFQILPWYILVILFILRPLRGILYYQIGQKCELMWSQKKNEIDSNMSKIVLIAN